MNLSAHFTLEELTASDYATRKGIDNTPTTEALSNLHLLSSGLERVRYILDSPMHINSGYRCPKLNSALGGSSKSQHMEGLAADFTAPSFGTPKEICEAIADHEDFIAFDQLIYEGTWVHVSFSDQPRGSILTAHFGNGVTNYTKGLSA